MKKIILLAGSVAAIVTPIVAVVSCGNKRGGDGSDSHSITDDNQNAAKHSKEVSDSIHKLFQQQAVSSQYDLSVNFKIDGQEIDVKEDGIYLVANDYKNGVLWNDKTLSAGGHIADKYVEVKETPGFALNHSMMLGDGDSVYLLYNNNDADGYDPSNFTNNIYFEDTSISGPIVDDNVKLGNIKADSSMFASNYITFAEGVTPGQGQLRPYLGSQNNHMTEGAGYASGSTFNSQILKMQETMGKTYPELFAKICAYYGVRVANGQVIDDTSILNHASRLFAPVFSSQPIFTYERVAKNAYKITYHFDNNSRITAAHFVLHSTKNADHRQDEQISSLTLGDKQEWDSYVGHPEATYVAIKNVYPQHTQTPRVEAPVTSRTIVDNAPANADPLATAKNNAIALLPQNEPMNKHFSDNKMPDVIAFNSDLKSIVDQIKEATTQVEIDKLVSQNADRLKQKLAAIIAK